MELGTGQIRQRTGSMRSDSFQSRNQSREFLDEILSPEFKHLDHDSQSKRDKDDDSTEFNIKDSSLSTAKFAFDRSEREQNTSLPTLLHNDIIIK